METSHLLWILAFGIFLIVVWYRPRQENEGHQQLVPIRYPSRTTLKQTRPKKMKRDHILAPHIASSPFKVAHAVTPPTPIPERPRPLIMEDPLMYETSSVEPLRSEVGPLDAQFTKETSPSALTEYVGTAR